jgi:hypothetical protein
MASVVQICKMALSHIGSEARISSISPPDGTVEAGYCASYYDPARTEMIELGNWQFTLKRAALTEVTNDSVSWAYAYALPSDCIKPRRIIQPQAGLTVFTQDEAWISPNDNNGAVFEVEGDVIRTNMPDAVLVYSSDVTDTTQFSPSFSTALSYLLASYLAGPIIRGNDGLRIGDGMRNRAMQMADASSANGTTERNDAVPDSIAARR